jgi:hypothetical protein
MASIAAYRDGIRAAYEGELIGERLYRMLAHGRRDADQRTKLDAIADVERLTNARLRPVAERLGIVPIDAELQAVVVRRAAELSALSWSEFIDKANREWPPYIVRFEALQPLAPSSDVAIVRSVVQHEIALVEFVRLEQSAVGSQTSLRVLEAFLLAAPL